jgi:NhaA family Na+:H+ antiporter
MTQQFYTHRGLYWRLGAFLQKALNPPQRRLGELREFLNVQALAGIALLLAAMAAIVAANTSFSPLYDRFLTTPVSVVIGELAIEKPLLLWINDGLMAIFFFLIGLELKREIMEGELSSINQVVLPLVAAVGGMAVPAGIYLALNGADPTLVRGWAIPTATDIAFALGILMLLGSRVPLALKVFLTTVAVFDDLGAIIVIAIFYTENLSMSVLALGLGGLAICLSFNRLNVVRIAPYILVGVAVWTCFLKSGVHATLAGVALGLTVPLKAQDPATGQSPLRHLEHGLHPWVAFMVLPLFAFANAGVRFDTLSLDLRSAALPAGIALGLVIGKQIGVFGTAWAMIRLGLASMPRATTWSMLYGVSLLCGIGFTMSLFIGGLAFDDAALASGVRAGVLSGSLVSGVLGFAVLRAVFKRHAASGSPTADGTAASGTGQAGSPDLNSPRSKAA